MTTGLLSEVEAFIAETGIEPHRFGLLATRNGRLVERLRKGQKYGLFASTEMRIRSFMMVHAGTKFVRRPLKKPRKKPVRKAKVAPANRTPKTEAASLT